MFTFTFYIPLTHEENSSAPEDFTSLAYLKKAWVRELLFKDPNPVYFNAYGRPSIHRTMLRDTARVKAYSNAISRTNMKGQIVLDVGTGTGILAMLAVKKGSAAKVYAGTKKRFFTNGKIPLFFIHCFS